MARSIPARIALAAGFLAATIAYGAWTTTRTALDPSATSEVADELLDSEPVRETLVEKLSEQVQSAIAAEELDPQVGQAIEDALADPRLLDAFRDAVTTLHRALLDGEKGEITLDVTEVTSALRDALAQVDPALATEFDNAEPIQIDLGDADVPALSDADDRMQPVLVASTLFAILFLVLGVAIHSSQRDALARVGRRVAMLAIGPVIGFVILPWILESTDHDAAQIAGTVLDVYGGRVLPSAAVLAIGGLSLWIGVRLWPKAGARESEVPYARPAPPNPYATTAERPTERMYL